MAGGMDNGEGGIADFKDQTVSGLYAEITQWGGDRIYMMPITIGSEVLYYNKTMFDALNLEEPKTWAEKKAAKKAAKQNKQEEVYKEQNAAVANAANDPAALGQYYRFAKFEFGAQFKADAKVNINDNFSYSTQVVLFVNYLDIKHCPRINWDNRIDWKLAKYFSLTLTTNLIYDDTIMIKNDKDINEYPDGKARVQFKESLAFGFTYTIANKK